MSSNGDEFSEDERPAAEPNGDASDAHEQDQDDEPEGEELRSGLPPKVDAWRRRSATGAILTGIALGFQQVFEPEKNEAAIIQETSGDPPKDLPVEAQVEHLRPRQSVVNIRPWLLPEPAPDADTVAEEPRGEEPTDEEP